MDSKLRTAEARAIQARDDDGISRDAPGIRSFTKGASIMWKNEEDHLTH